MQYRLLALDLDGTLVTSHGGITEAAKQAVWSYIDAGGVVALPPGRPTPGPVARPGAAAGPKRRLFAVL